MQVRERLGQHDQEKVTKALPRGLAQAAAAAESLQQRLKARDDSHLAFGEILHSVSALVKRKMFFKNY